MKIVHSNFYNLIVWKNTNENYFATITAKYEYDYL